MCHGKPAGGLQVDNRHQDELLVSAEAAVKLCDRNFGIGGDGVSRAAEIPLQCALTALSLKTYVSRLPVSQVIFALPPKGEVDYTMRIYNSDGSEPEMCGNGIRCLARFVAEKDNQGPRQYKVLTGAGKLPHTTSSSHPTCLWLKLLCSLCSIHQYSDGRTKMFANAAQD